MTLRLHELDARDVPAVVTDLFAVGSGPGIEAQVKVFNADGTERFNLTPFPGFTGGAAVTTGDITGDEIDDIAIAAGAGGGPHVKLIDGATGAEIDSFFAFDPNFRGGAFVGLGDVTGDGKAELVAGAGEGGGPHVQVFDGVTRQVIRSFFAYDPNFRGGVTVRAGDVTGDGLADIVTGAGPGGAPHVRAFDSTTLEVVRNFFGGDPESREGVFVGVADFTGAGAAQITASANGRIVAPGYIEQDNAVNVANGGPITVAAVRQPTGIIAILIGITDGTSNITDGTSNTIFSGTSTIRDGTSNVVLRNAGISAAVGRIETAAAAAGVSNLLATGLQTIKDGTSNISAGTAAISTGLTLITNGTKSIKDGTSNIAAATATIRAGSDRIAAGLATVNAALARAGGGTSAILDGTSNIASGTRGILDGTSNIVSATNAVNAALGTVDAILISSTFGSSFTGGVFVG